MCIRDRSKVDLEVARYYVDTLGSKENKDSFDVIFGVISKEYNLTKSLILEITGKNKLLESDKDLKSSVSLRNKISSHWDFCRFHF